MLGLFRPRLPISDDDREWVDDGFLRLESALGRRRMLEANVVTPTAESFPDPYDRTPESGEKMFERVCEYMNVDHGRITLEWVPDQADELKKFIPAWEEHSRDFAGLYIHDHTGQNSDGTSTEATSGERIVVALKEKRLDDPLSLVATMAHELGHVILLGGKLIDPKTPDHEPLTDLLTVYLGLGIFTANSAARFQQYQDERRGGWSMRRLGYMPEEAFGYALAKFATERGERNAAWAKHLSTNIKSYFNRSRRWLLKNPAATTQAPLSS